MGQNSSADWVYTARSTFFVTITSIVKKCLKKFARIYPDEEVNSVSSHAGLGLPWLWYPMLWSQGRNSGAHGAEISIQISALAGVEPRTLASSSRDVATTLLRTPPFSCLL